MWQYDVVMNAEGWIDGWLYHDEFLLYIYMSMNESFNHNIKNDLEYNEQLFNLY